MLSPVPMCVILTNFLFNLNFQTVRQKKLKKKTNEINEALKVTSDQELKHARASITIKRDI